jgi:hypothetical protein
MGQSRPRLPALAPPDVRCASISDKSFAAPLERSFDPAAGEVDLFPQEITRALLNLISNGFYAATKRKAESNGGDYEPTLVAATRNLGDKVEIRIRDNGTGIPPDAKEKLFNPVLYDQARRGRNWAWPFHQSRHHCQATLGVYRGRYAARRVH